MEVIDAASTDALLARLNEMDLSPSSTLPAELVSDMIRHLGDSRGMCRLGLVDHFGTIGSRAVPDLLSSLASHANPVVRRSSGKALAKIADPVATDGLLNALENDTDAVTRASASGALAKMGCGAITKLLNLIATAGVDMVVKGQATWALSFIMQTDATGSYPIVLQQLGPETAVDVRIAAVSALGAIAIGDALPSMSGEGSADDWDDADVDSSERDEMRNRAVQLIGKALTDTSAQVRAEASTAIANAGAGSYAPDIVALLDDEDMETKRCAALSLMKLGDTSYIPVLQAKASDESAEASDLKNIYKLVISSLQRNLSEQEELV